MFMTVLIPFSTVSYVSNLGLKARADARNIVGFNMLWALLEIVGCCWMKFETGQTF